MDSFATRLNNYLEIVDYEKEDKDHEVLKHIGLSNRDKYILYQVLSGKKYTDISRNDLLKYTPKPYRKKIFPPRNITPVAVRNNFFKSVRKINNIGKLHKYNNLCFHSPILNDFIFIDAHFYFENIKTIVNKCKQQNKGRTK